MVLRSFFLRLLCCSAALRATYGQSIPSVDVCADDATAPAQCCDVMPENPCFIEGFYRAGLSCSNACKKRYQQLGWQCYEDYKKHVQWKAQQASCDPEGIVVFNRPVIGGTPTQAPEAQGVPSIASASRAHLPLEALMMALAALLSATCMDRH
mmetsp:Transcript_17421/g.40698  ORF Transcript_17421/g.40698 Transcript_17421/m.40698 type:complete len:153 (+) Transcript_17421:70-528(+)